MTILSPAETFRRSLKAFQGDALQELIDSGALTKRRYNKHVRRNTNKPKEKCTCHHCGNKDNEFVKVEIQ